MKCEIEIFLNGAWHSAATFQLKDSDERQIGYKGGGFFEYDLSYAYKHLNATAIEAVSSLYPVNFEIHTTSAWPSFLLDILPSGANRKYFLNELGIPNNPNADWPLLLKGGGNPPGNIRIAQAAPVPAHEKIHEGFDFEDVFSKAEYFIEYAKQNNAPVAGSSGAQGDAPKFLLTQDKHGKFHADGALPDHLADKHWLVKFPRGKNQSDRDILCNENAYYKVARAVGLHVCPKMTFEPNALFMPRFDRKVTRRGVLRYGLESLSSLAGISDFGVTVAMEKLCAVLNQYSSAPTADIKEFIFRDILNVALGNTDNHGRNSAVLKYPNGAIRLSPLYDFAPMFLDDQGIPRVCRWTGAESWGIPEWGKVAELLKDVITDTAQLRSELSDFAEIINKLPEIMVNCGVDHWLVDRLRSRIDDVKRSLKAARPLI
jgi:serine/threonine-protein kinase HipA